MGVFTLSDIQLPAPRVISKSETGTRASGGLLKHKLFERVWGTHRPDQIELGPSAVV